MNNDPDLEYAMIEGPFVLGPQKATGAKGGSKSGHQALTRRVDHQDRGAGGRAWKSCAVRAATGTGA